MLKTQLISEELKEKRYKDHLLKVQRHFIELGIMVKKLKEAADNHVDGQSLVSSSSTPILTRFQMKKSSSQKSIDVVRRANLVKIRRNLEVSELEASIIDKNERKDDYLKKQIKLLKAMRKNKV